jgi:hypothetical protein
MKRAHLGLSILVLSGCAGLIGVPDLSFDGNAGASRDGGPNSDANSTADGSTSPDDGGVPACNAADVATDPHHCGRCGHDCLGGACVAGKCQSVVLKNALENPDDLAFDSTYVYVSTRANGAVVRIAKDGSGATAIVTGQQETRGVALDGQNLYWSNTYYAGDGGPPDNYWGGIWSCVLPACADKKLVTLADWPVNVRFSGASLFFAESNNSSVVSVKPDGNLRTALDNNVTQPFGVAVDGQHVYYTSGSGLERTPITPVDGGSPETIDPLSTATDVGYVAVDDERVYYAYGISNGDGRVYSVPKATPNGPKEQYGTANKASLGVAVDATTLYWTNAGTFDAQTNVNNHDGSIMACPKAGCGGNPPTVLETGILWPLTLGVDGDAIYYLVFGSARDATDGELRRIAKP